MPSAPWWGGCCPPQPLPDGPGRLRAPRLLRPLQARPSGRDSRAPHQGPVAQGQRWPGQQPPCPPGSGRGPGAAAQPTVAAVGLKRPGDSLRSTPGKCPDREGPTRLALGGSPGASSRPGCLVPSSSLGSPTPWTAPRQMPP